MQIDDLDTVGVRRSDLFAAALQAIGVDPQSASFVVAAKEEKRWHFWIATEVGLVIGSHAEGDADVDALPRVALSEILSWDTLDPFTVTTETWRERGPTTKTRIKVAFDKRELESSAIEGVADEIGLFAFAQACLRWRAGVPRAAAP